MSLFYLLTVIICGGYVLLLISYYIGWRKTAPLSLGRGVGGEVTLCTIILPVRNEEKNILHILQHLSGQDYPGDKFEIIVVDDLSSDKTRELVQQSNFSNVKLISLSKGEGKKKAIAEGISKASGTLIVTTDADCEMGKNWLSSLVAFYEKHRPKMIVAPVLLHSEKSFQELFQSQELTILTACACGSLKYDLPILCSGANLAYEKEAFLAINGFEGVDKTATGDDVFLMIKIGQKFPGEIKYLKSEEAVVYTHPEWTTGLALNQRKRWASKNFSYGFSHITAIAALVFFTNFLVFFLGILSVINIKFVFLLIGSLSAKCLVDLMLLYSASSFFKKRYNPLTAVSALILYPVYVSFVGLISPFAQYSWKGRKS